jgi:predicted GNAT family acetyltransferase
MIRLLTNNDHNVLMKYILQDKDLNPFIIGDIENYGYDKEFQKVWGEFDNESNLTAVMLKHFRNFILYSKSDFDTTSFINILRNEAFNKISGEKSTMKKIESVGNFSGSLDQYICKLSNGSRLLNDSQLSLVKQAGLDDVDKIINLYNSIDEFKIYGNKPDNIIRRIKDKTGRVYYIEKDGQFVAVAQSSAESSSSAVIVGVCTHNNYRKQGLSSICLSKLCKDLLDEGKTVYLYYDNPTAGLLYKKLGFEEIGIWTNYFK